MYDPLHYEKEILFSCLWKHNLHIFYNLFETDLLSVHIISFMYLVK